MWQLSEAWGVLLGAILGALITAAALLYTSRQERQRHADLDQRLRELNEKESGLQKREQRVAEQEAILKRDKEAMSGSPSKYKVGSWSTTLELHEDGSGILTRECTNIITPQQEYELKIPYRLGTDIGSFKDRKPLLTRAEGCVIDPEWEEKKVAGGRIEGRIWFRGLQNHAGAILGFRAVHPVGKAFCASKEEAEEEYKNSDFKQEYFGTTVEVQVDVMELKVKFAPTYNGLPSAVVFFGASEEVHWGEVQRINDRKWFAWTDHLATLRVNEPQRGHQYAVAWNPPPQAPVSATA